MTRRTLAATERNGKGKTVRVNLNLDATSLQAIFRHPVGLGGAFVRKTMAQLLELDPEAFPPQVPGGETSIFAFRAPQDLIDRARAYVGPGKPYTTLSGLARTAIHDASKRKG